MTSLYDPLRLGDITLANRLVMAPLTRNRAGAGNVPTQLMAEYYRQRAHPEAGAGLIVTEASQISPMGQGYQDTPGIHSPEQVAGWQHVTRAVHEAGGKVFIQLWHVGRISHSKLLPGGAQPVSSTARVAKTRTFVEGAFVPVSEPRALRTDEIPGIVADYRRAAGLAMQAGFDGVELHAANGYLIEQFLRDSLNDRTDAYGGGIEQRTQLLVEALEAITAEIGGGRTGVRLSPITPANDIGQDSNAQALFNRAVERIAPLGLAYVHVVEGATGGPRDLSDQGIAPFDYGALKARFPGAWMVNNAYDRAMAEAAVASGAADLVAFGKAFIANPDLARRLREGAALNTPDTATFYGGGERGYTDYPVLA
jgi:N-ethylmaleimide reductase